DIEGYPDGAMFEADSIRLAYRPAAIIIGEFNADAAGARFEYKELTVPLKLYHQGDLTTIALRVRGQDVGGIKGFVPGALALEGRIDAEGDIILKGYKPYLINIAFRGGPLDCVCNGSLKLSGTVEGTITGNAGKPFLCGIVQLKKVFLIESLQSLLALNTQKEMLASGPLHNAVINIGVNGRQVPIRDGRYVDAYVNCFLDIRKESDDYLPYLSGGIDVARGIYKAYDKVITLTKGQVVCEQKGRPPFFDFEGILTLDGYAMSGSLKGTHDDAVLYLAAQPALGYRDIASLVMFGEKIEKIKTLEKDKLFSREFSNIVLKDLFFGIVKARAVSAMRDEDALRIECYWES
ncbi:MAG: hypothetical protein PHS37_06660, partial [Candidatus Omnitrophica bacterium]|nr:hypothetical protein [Candidatus Omnitrophota bacterium]